MSEMEIPYEVMLREMKKEIFALQRVINHTPKWRVIKRYTLLEKLYKLEEDYGLLSHVFDPNDELQ